MHHDTFIKTVLINRLSYKEKEQQKREFHEYKKKEIKVYKEIKSVKEYNIIEYR
jgi:hypothetical protein